MHVGTCIQIARDTFGMYTRACSLFLVAHLWLKVALSKPLWVQFIASVELLKLTSHTLGSTMANQNAAGASLDAGMTDAYTDAHSTNIM